MATEVLANEHRVTTVEEWSRAWEAFHTAARALKAIADKDGDLLKIDITFKAGGLRNKAALDVPKGNKNV